MSAIAAVFARDGHLNPFEVGAIVKSMAARAPHASDVWQSGAIALGHASLRTCPAETPEVRRRTLPEDACGQPVRHAASGSVIVFDGRIDARADLAAASGIEGREAEQMSDAALLLRAYLARGARILREVLGDFACALWDAPNRQLICARDVLGLRPLFYTATDREVVVASELQAVLRGRAAAPNTGMVAEALTGMQTSRDETLFAGVFRVPPGSALVVNQRSCRITQFVSLEAPAPAGHRDEADYIAQFRGIFEAAVRDRLRSTAKAAVMLSGGVDSSTVYAAARSCSHVDAYTIGYEDAAFDETRIAQATVARNGGALHCAGLSAATYDYNAEIERYRDLPTNPSGANSAALRRQAARDGVTVLLSGVGGDEGFLGHTGRWADWLRSGHWSLLWHELKSWRFSADPVAWPTLARTTVQPLIPAQLRRLGSALRHRGSPFPWVPQRFLDETNLVNRVRQASGESGPPSPRLRAPRAAAARGTRLRRPRPTHAITGMIRSFVDGAAVAAWEEEERLAARFHQDERMPYLDRRVIAFALSLPETLRSRPGCPKYFVRHAWHDRLAPEVMNPLDAPDYTFQIVDALEAQGGCARFDNLAIADCGWVDRAEVCRMSEQLFTTARTSRRFIAHAWRLWSILVVDEWYRRALGARIKTPDLSVSSVSSVGPIAAAAAFDYTDRYG